MPCVMSFNKPGANKISDWGSINTHNDVLMTFLANNFDTLNVYLTFLSKQHLLTNTNDVSHGDGPL